MKSAMVFVLAALGAAILGLAAAVAFLPPGHVQAALLALRQGPPTPPKAAPASEADLPLEAGVLLEARRRLVEDREAFEQERAVAAAQLTSERAEIEVLRKGVEGRQAELARSAKSAAAAPPLAGGPAAAASEKGVKALALVASRMAPASAVKLLSQEGEASAARILARMEPRQAGKVMAAFVEAEPEKAGRVAGLLEKGQ